MKFKSTSKGFTLIELLVVVAIISLLSSVVLAALGSAREKARITKFKQEIDQFVNAVELYRSDNNGNLPGYVDGSQMYFFMYTEMNGNIQSTDEYYSEFHEDLLPYIPSIPIPTSGSWYYYVNENVVRCANEQDPYSYLILVASSNPGFDDWPGWQIFSNGNWGAENTTYRCRSF